MINKQLITRRFSRAVESYNREAVVQKQIAYRMSDMLNHYLPRPWQGMPSPFLFQKDRICLYHARHYSGLFLPSCFLNVVILC